VAKRICRFSAAAPSAQCIESPRSHLILDNKPHTRTKSRGLQTTPRQFTQEEGRGRDRRITRRSFPTDQQVAHNSREDHTTPMNTHCGSVRRKQRVPPQNTPYATHAYTYRRPTPLTQSASSAVHSPANIQPKALPSRLRSIK
jgi:hypothetical protein